MNDKLNRRTLGKTAGVLAGGSVAARMTSIAAQEATPSASPVAAETVDLIVSAWPDVPREVAQTVMDKYGPPQEATPSRLIWFDNAP